MAGMRITLEGADGLIAKLAALDDVAHQRGKRATQRSTDVVVERIKEGITSPPKTGRIYTQRFATSRHGGVFAYGSRTPHQASAAGEYPASDTGTLLGSIWGEVEDRLAALDLHGDFNLSLDSMIEAGDKISGVMGADAEYAAPLEYKPPGRGGRPFMRRGLTESGDDIKDIFREELRGAFSGGGR